MILGVVGAGTMGAGIAQLGAQAGMRTRLHDPDPDALARGLERIAKRTDEPVEPAASLDELADCELVIEAAPERLELKRELFAALAERIAPDAVLATNTSSLSVTEIAAGVDRPERVVGLHFFNPAPVMALAEVVAGAQSSPEAVAVARAAAEAMGKRVIDARDIAGFLVNRVNRPFSLESLKLLEERVAGVETIDRALRLGAGFPMGPFELMDLVGLDVNHGVAESFRAQSYGEPRYRPSPLAARQVAAGRLGRKTGRGWYAYPDGRPEDPPAPPAMSGDGRRVAVLGDEPLALEVAAALHEAGFELGESEPWLTISFGPAAPGPLLRIVREDFLHVTEPAAAGFHAVAPFAEARLVELTRTERTDPDAFARAEALFAALGRHTVAVEDVPGLVTGRIVCQLVNEAAFLLGEGNGTADDVDAGLELGLRHPRGPVAWSEAIGLPAVVATLDGLHRALGEERYRVAPLLRKRAATGGGLR
ncbi:MAG: 3-hydroxybutyryl-CoA dehydrogenase [Solirubrobacteraceae bacterium]|nr:3-hydroxybutyryl-CoA dehydrogenase [Solirubrobacteraceae bacterium]